MSSEAVPGAIPTARSLASLLRLRSCWFEPFPFDDLIPRIEPGRIVLPAQEPALGPWTIDHGIELPVRCNGLPLGRFVLIPSDPTVGVAFPPAARVAALRLAASFGVRLARRWLTADARARTA